MPFKAGAIYGEASLDTRKWDTGLKRIGKSATIAFAAIAGAATVYMAKAIKAADEYQKALSNTASITDASKVSTQELSKSLLKLDPALGDTTDLAKGMYQAFSAGAKDSAEAMSIVEQSAILAKATLTDTSTAVDIITTAMNAYGHEVVNAQEASDIFFTTVKDGKVTGEELAASIGTSIPIFANAGISLQELSAGVAEMTKQGVNAHRATTQLNAIVTSFLKPSEAMTKQLKAMGYESGSAFLKAKGLSGAMDMLKEATGGDSAKIAELVPNIRAMKGVMALTGAGAEDFKNILDDMNNSAGNSKTAFEEQEKTFDTLKNSLDKIQLVVGNIGKFFLDKIVVGAITAGKAILDFIMSNRGMEIVSSVVSKVAGAFELVKQGIEIIVDNLREPMQDFLSTIKRSFDRLRKPTEDNSGAMKLFSIAVQTTSMGLSVLIKVIEVSINNIVNLVTAITNSGKTIGSFFQLITGKVSFKEVKQNFADTKKAFANFGKEVFTGFGDIINEVEEQFKDFGKGTESTLLTVTTHVKTASDNAKSAVVNNWDAMVTGQTSFLEEYLKNKKEQTETEEQGNEDIEESTEKTAEAIVETEEEKQKRLEELRQQEVDDFLAISKEQERIKLEQYKKEVKAKEEELRKKKELEKAYWGNLTSGTKEVYSQLSELSNLYLDTEENKLAVWYDDKLNKLQEDLNNEVITKEEFDKKKGELDEENKRKENDMKRKAFDTNKKFEKVNVIMDAASAIMGWWRAATALGPIAGPIFAGTMSAITATMTGVQLALIDQQKFIPSRAKGGRSSGLTRINEQGGEIQYLPDNTIVIPNDISRQIARSVGKGNEGTIINVSFEGATISNEMDLEYVTEEVSRRLGRELITA